MMASESRREKQNLNPTSSFRFVPHANDRVTKRRSNIACLECRRRKVRCDIITQQPDRCTNCRLNGISCQVKQNQRQRREASPTSPPITPVSESVSHQVLEATNITLNDSELQWQRNGVNTHTVHPSLSPSRSHQRGLDNLEPKSNSQLTCSRNIQLPSFIKPLSMSLRSEEWDFLSARRCFAFPPLVFQRIIINRYMQYIYPLLPVISIDNYITILTGKTFKGRVSLALYHALMGAGLAAVEEDIISEYGYDSKAAARDDFYSKAKALLDMNAGVSRLVICQAALLLVGWSTNTDPKDGYHWMGIAINYALSMNLHKQFSTSSRWNIDNSFRKRIWWTVAMLEADVCLCTGRPPRVNTSEVPDFSIYDATEMTELACHDLSGLNTIADDLEQHHLLQIVCVEKAKLAVIVLKVMSYLDSGDGGRAVLETKNAKVWQLDGILRDWEHNLPLGMGCLMRSSTWAAASRDALLTIAMVILNYLTALIILHKAEVPSRSWAVATEEQTGSLPDDQICWYQAHARAMRRAANDITQIYVELSNSGLTNVIPGMGIPTLCAAVGVHLLDARSEQDAVRLRSLEKLEICLTVLREVGKLNYTAKEIAKLVEAAVGQASQFNSRTVPRAVQHLRQTHSVPASASHTDSGIANSHLEDVHQHQASGIGGNDMGIENFAQDGREFYSPDWTDPFLQMEGFFNFEVSDDLLIE